MPVGVVPHYRPCLLVNCHCNRYFTSRVQMKDGWSLVLPVQWWHYIRHVCWWVPLSNKPACTVQLYQTCMLGSFIQIRVFVKCCSIRQGFWSVTNQSDMPTGRVLLPGVCKTCRLPSGAPSWIYQILNDAWIASLGCYNDNVIQESNK